MTSHKLALACSLLLAVAPGARAAECPPIWISQSAYTIWGPPDPNSPPNQTQLPESLSEYGYVPAVAIHTVAAANGMPIVINTKAWCRDVTGDPTSDSASATNPHVISNASASLADGSVAVVEQSSTSGGGAASQASALFQLGFRDVLHANAAGTELVPITLRRVISGTWTLDEGNGSTLDQFILRNFVMTLWERTQPTGPQQWTRRLLVDDHDLNGFLNGEQTYDFEVLPGKDLILSLYVSGQASCIGDSTFGDPPTQYPDCYSYLDFGGAFGEPITFTFEPGAGVALTSEAGFTQYVPEPSEDALGEVACAGLVATFATRRRRPA
jgi:hypothetical protein